MLCDWKIRNLCQSHGLVDPFSESVDGEGIISFGLTSGGYDLRLGTEAFVLKNTYAEILDPRRFKDENYRNRVFDRIESRIEDVVVTNFGNMEIHTPFIIPPHSYILGTSFEYLKIPRNMKAQCVGKSTYARMGIIVNTTPLEPEWQGNLTIEISNSSPCPVMIFPMQGIAQIEFYFTDGICETSYADKKGKYQSQKGVTPALVK